MSVEKFNPQLMAATNRKGIAIFPIFFMDILHSLKMHFLVLESYMDRMNPNVPKKRFKLVGIKINSGLYMSKYTITNNIIFFNKDI